MKTSLVGSYLSCLLCVLCLLCITTTSCGAAPLPRGVHPADEQRYSGTTFSCKDGSKTGLPIAKVNDDYCDCADGSDEPGTSACPNGRFLCRNLGHIGLSLYSSRVNDGICDCCDGTDEYDGKVKCQDTCYSLGEESRAAKRREVEAFKKGLEIRKQYVNQAKTEKEEKQKQLDELKAALAQKQQQKDALQGQVDELEKKANAAKELLAKYKPKEVEVTTEPDAAPKQMEVPEGKIENEDHEDEDDDGDDDDDLEDDDDGDDDEEPNQEQPKEELLERTEEVREMLEQAEKDVAEYSLYKAHKLTHRKEEEDGDEDEEEGGLSSLWQKLESFLGLTSSDSLSLPLSREVKISDWRELKQRLSNAQTELDNTQREINTLEDYFKLDLGDEAFNGIRDQVFELHTNQYTYKLSPFKDVKQQHTRLGDWRQWLDAEHTTMEYAGGERCWNGPERKTIVKLSCGEANKVISVEEPNKCEYLMKFTTPAACSPATLAQLEADLAVLENPTVAILPPLSTNEIF